MNTTQAIANLLKVSLADAAKYCQQVRQYSGLGQVLQYKAIYKHLLSCESQYPAAQEVGKTLSKANSSFISSRKKSGPTVPPISSKKNKAQSSPGKKLNIYERFDVPVNNDEIEREPFIPSRLPKDVEIYSHHDNQRLQKEKMSHCPHGIPSGILCAICNPKEFRRMTGID
jgi:hypothetical protein